jgi:hypothetical protein
VPWQSSRSQANAPSYFIHSIIPGLGYDGFLDQVLTFLNAHPQEIAVVQLRSDGILTKVVELPSAADKNQILNAALGRHSGLSAGTLNDLKTQTVKQLRDAGKRLIILDNANQYSSYDDASYATLTGESILAALERMTSAAQASHDFTLLQRQATATNLKDPLIYSILTSNASTSILMSSKAFCDTKTQPFLHDTVLNQLTVDQSVMLMNDWFDGATADVAVAMSISRLSK